MIGRVVLQETKPGRYGAAGTCLFLILLLAWARTPLSGQSHLPEDRIHVSVTLGGYFLLGVGYTHWLEEHHTLEMTVFPFAWPWEGFPFGIRAGYAWVPSDEVWRAKLGANATFIIRPGQTGADRFTPIVAFTPGIQYNPDHERSFRTDLWISYYVREKVLAPTALEFLFYWPK